MFIDLPNAVLHAIGRLNNAGYEAYAVGGCVRDSLMGKTPLDWDITSSATPDEMRRVFDGYRCIETGLPHGTLTVIVDGVSLEITTYRVDGDYSDGRHPDRVTFTRSLAEDLRRRDFTINAMAYHPTVGLVDLYGGQEDVQKGVIRCVGDPERRFGEDALRILRALRFASVLGFSLDDDTSSALRRLAPTLTRVAMERIAVELQKLLCGQNVCNVADKYRSVLSIVLPALPPFSDVSLLTMVSAVPYVRFAAFFLLSDCSVDDAKATMRHLRMDNRTMGRVERLLICRNWPSNTDADLLQLLNLLDQDLIFHHLALCRAEEETVCRVRSLLESKRCYNVSMLAVNGTDAIEAGVKAGPDVGRVLQALLDAVIKGECLNEKANLLEHIAKTKKPVQ